MALNTGTLIGERYQVIRELGGGGMKLVYLVEDRRLNRKAALAEMIDSFTRPADQAAAVAAFQREADLLAKIESEYIPRIFDRFSENNRHYLVMEYVPGRTLEERLTGAGGKLDEKFIVDVAAQILDALAYLHCLTPPIIYRDLKPSNLILKADGRVKMVDFGIARHFQPQNTATMVGTQGYAPPEQYIGKVETRSDLYALGATLHHLLTGRDPASAPPFSFPPTCDLRPDINPLLADLVDEALAYDVAQRIPSAQEFKRRLDRIKGKSQGLPAAARVTSPPPADAATVVLRPKHVDDGGHDLHDRGTRRSPAARGALPELRTFDFGRRDRLPLLPGTIARKDREPNLAAGSGYRCVRGTWFRRHTQAGTRWNGRDSKQVARNRSGRI